MGQAHEGVLQVPQKIILTVNPVTAVQVQGIVNTKPVLFMIDTGAAVSLIDCKCWNRIKVAEDKLDGHRAPALVGVNGSRLQIHGTTELKVCLEGQKFNISVIVVESLQVGAIIGMDFLESNHCVIDTSSKSLQIRGLKHPIPLHQLSNTPVGLYHTWAVLPKTIHVPGNSELEVMAKVEMEATDGTPTLLLEGRSLPRQPSVLVEAAVVKASGDQQIPIRMVNWAPDPITVYQGTRLATLEEIDSEMIVSGVEPTEHTIKEVSEAKRELLWDTVERAAANLTTSQRDKFYEALLCYEDVFVVDNSDLGCTNRLKHHINTGDAAPVRQPPRRISPHRQEEVTALLADMENRGIIQPSKSPWASPVVLVQKRQYLSFLCRLQESK